MESDAFKVYDSHKKADAPDSSSLGIPISGTRAIAHLSTEKRSGHEYTTLSIKKIIVPVEPGSHSLQPAEITCSISKSAVKYARQSRKGTGNLYQYPLYFDNAFFNMETAPGDRDVSAASTETSIIARKLPRGAPELFNGLVGQYDLSVNLSTNSVRQGDPLTLSMEVSGEGYLSHVTMPPLELQGGLTNSFRVASDRRLRSIDGERIVFSQTVYALRPGDQPFPTLSLCYFNPDSGKYETVDSKPLPLSVTKANVIDGSIFGLDEEVAEERMDWQRWAAAVIALILLAAFRYRRYSRFEKKPIDRSADMAAAYKQFQDTVTLLKKTDFSSAGDQHQALNSALANVLSAHLVNHKPGAITFTDLDALLAETGAGSDARKKAEALFKEMDMCRFSPAGPTMDFDKALSYATEIIETLSR
jgi:hypothetical protein